MKNIMKAAAVTGKSRVELIEVEVPEPRHGQVLIKIDTCLLCTWERRIFTGEAAMKLPFIPGHEASGTIVKIPEGMISSFNEGDSVVFKTLDDCGHCCFCYQGHNNICTGKPERRRYNGISSSGGLAEYISVDVNKVFKVSSDISLQEAAFAEPLACCIHSIRRADPDFGDNVVIIGAGIMGMLHLKLSVLRGCRVMVIEPDAKRQEMARKYGAHFVIDPGKDDPQKAVMEITDGEKAGYVFVTTANPSVVRDPLMFLNKRGTIVFYSSFHPNEPVEIDPNLIHYGEFIITGSFSPSTRDFFTASRLLSGGLVDVKDFLSGEYNFENIDMAFKAALEPGIFRVAVRFPDVRQEL